MATAPLDVVHVPPAVVLVKIVLEPTHVLGVPPIAASEGNAFTLTITISVLLQLLVVPVTVYVVVVVGVTVNDADVPTTPEPSFQE